MSVPSLQQPTLMHTNPLDTPAFGGTPLAMLTAQCNKINDISTPAPPPPSSIADISTNRGFQPWKRSPASGESLMSYHDNAERSSPMTSTSSPTNTSNSPSSTQSPSLTSQKYLGYPGESPYLPGTGSSFSAAAAAQSDLASYSGMYSRMTGLSGHLYDAWPYLSTHPSASVPPNNLKNSQLNYSSPSLLDIHGSGGPHPPPPPTWISDISSPLTSYPPVDHHLGPLQPTSSSLLSSSAQGLEAYKSLYQATSQNDPLGASVPGSYLSRPPPVSASMPTKSGGSKRYPGRFTCDCPNCQEADRLGPAGDAIRKRNQHTCHIPGCGKVYNKSSHLKAHLRWHTVGKKEHFDGFKRHSNVSDKDKKSKAKKIPSGTA